MTRQMTLEEFQAAGEASGWRFCCPMCGNVATPLDFKATGASPQRAAQECIGRTMTPMPQPEKGKKPCNWAAFGLLRIGGIMVKFADGTESPAFGFVDTP